MSNFLKSIKGNPSSNELKANGFILHLLHEYSGRYSSRKCWIFITKSRWRL